MTFLKYVPLIEKKNQKIHANVTDGLIMKDVLWPERRHLFCL